MPKDDPTDLTSLLNHRRRGKKDLNTKESSPPQKNDESGTEQKSARKVGRPRGRRSNPSVSSLTLLIDAGVVNDTKYNLGRQNLGKDPADKESLSDLVEELLKDWLKDQNT